MEKVGEFWLDSTLTMNTMIIEALYNKNMDPKWIWQEAMCQLFCVEEISCSEKGNKGGKGSGKQVLCGAAEGTGVV